MHLLLLALPLVVELDRALVTVGKGSRATHGGGGGWHVCVCGGRRLWRHTHHSDGSGARVGRSSSGQSAMARKRGEKDEKERKKWQSKKRSQ